jgi:hypothetical protein
LSARAADRKQDEARDGGQNQNQRTDADDDETSRRLVDKMERTMVLIVWIKVA